MSALANILSDLGHEVRGVDYNKKYFTEATFRKSIVVESFENYNLESEYFYIIGNAFKIHNLTSKIKDIGYQHMSYPQFLETFFKMKKIGISGSHGKTTTTSFLSQLLESKVNALVGDGSGFGCKDAKYFLFEACEYQNHFLNYTFEYLVVLNIDYDHPDFFLTPQEYFHAFQKAVLNSKLLIVNFDDPICRKLVHKNKITYGFDSDSDVVIRLSGNKICLTFLEDEYEFDFNYPGKYMAYNLAASFIVSYLILENKEAICDKMKNLKLPARRFEEKTTDNGIVMVNDYAHHPTEIAVVVDALKNKYPTKSIVVVYQGHTYSRTSAFFDDYVTSLKKADDVFIMPTFSSVREKDFDPYQLLSGDKCFKKYDRNVLKSLLQSGNIVLAFLGAGDVDSEFNIFVHKNINY